MDGKRSADEEQRVSFGKRMTFRARQVAWALFAALLLSLPPGAQARAFSGGDLLARCGAPEGDSERGYCEGFLESFLAAGHAEMVYLRSGCSTSKCRVDTGDSGRGQLSGEEWCLPAGLARDSLLEHLAKRLAGDMIGRQAPAPLVVAEYLAEDWPCSD
jgi:hypothetical protein